MTGCKWRGGSANSSSQRTLSIFEQSPPYHTLLSVMNNLSCSTVVILLQATGHKDLIEQRCCGSLPSGGGKQRVEGVKTCSECTGKLPAGAFKWRQGWRGE